MRWQINGFMFPELAAAQPVPRVLGHLRGHQPLTDTPWSHSEAWG